MAENDRMEKLVSLCKRRGFVFQSSEIYGGVGSVWDYGPLGVELKRNIKDRWWRSMVHARDDIEGHRRRHPDAPAGVGGVGSRGDVSTTRWSTAAPARPASRADKLADAQCPQKPSKHPGEHTTCDLTEPRQFNMMFKTFMGPVVDSASVVYLRPETAQGIYVNYLNVLQASRQKIPFGIAQIGKAFRNEITPGNFIFRTREFEQMEMQFFVKPGTEDDWFEQWREIRWQWHLALGIRPERLRWYQTKPDELAHYARPRTTSSTSFRSAGTSSRGFTTAPTTTSSATQSFRARNSILRPGKERALDPVRRRDPRSVPTAAPWRCCATPTTRSRSRVSRAWCCGSIPRWHRSRPRCCRWSRRTACRRSPTGSTTISRGSSRCSTTTAGPWAAAIAGRTRRARRFCITVDGQTKDDQTVTVRYRDSMKQERLDASRLEGWLAEQVRG